MSAAFLNQLADAMKACAISAGTNPAEGVRPIVVDVLREVGTDLNQARP